MNQKDISQPHFEPVLVADNLEDGYWLEAVDINGDGKPDLVASGLAIGEVVWYENPSWKKHPIAKFPKPVALDQADVDGDGRLDFATTGYYTPGYFLADNPQILVCLNRFAEASADLVEPYATPQVPG